MTNDILKTYSNDTILTTYDYLFSKLTHGENSFNLKATMKLQKTVICLRYIKTVWLKYVIFGLSKITQLLMRERS